MAEPNSIGWACQRSVARRTRTSLMTIAIPMGAPGQQVAEGRLSLQDKQAAAAAIAAIDTSRDDEVKEAYLYDSRTGLSKTKELRSEALKAKPAMFDASGLVVQQLFATSLDGTRIPYVVNPPCTVCSRWRADDFHQRN